MAKTEHNIVSLKLTAKVTYTGQLFWDTCQAIHSQVNTIAYE